LWYNYYIRKEREESIMSKRKHKKGSPVSNTDLARTIRRDWNGINPVSRVVESKKRKPVKHKKREMERESEV
jgi:hypothetical protein